MCEGWVSQKKQMGLFDDGGVMKKGDRPGSWVEGEGPFIHPGLRPVGSPMTECAGTIQEGIREAATSLEDQRRRTSVKRQASVKRRA